MTRGRRMPRGVLVLRVVAAADLATRDTEPQVHPGVTLLDALRAAAFRLRTVRQLAEVLTRLIDHGDTSFVRTGDS
jgi:hypothetical protein